MNSGNVSILPAFIISALSTHHKFRQYQCLNRYQPWFLRVETLLDDHDGYSDCIRYTWFSLPRKSHFSA